MRIEQFNDNKTEQGKNAHTLDDKKRTGFYGVPGPVGLPRGR